MALAPNGKRTLFSARGDIFSVPSENGATRNLTGTPGADEDHPAWSPDGRTVAYTTDVTGGQQIAIRPAEGGAETILTHFDKGYFYGPQFSPDGKTLAFTDGEHKLWTVRTDGGAPKQVAQDPQSEIHDQAFSPDGRWLAFSMSAFDTASAISTSMKSPAGRRPSSRQGRRSRPGADVVAGRQISLFHLQPAREHRADRSRVRLRALEVASGLYRHPPGQGHARAAGPAVSDLKSLERPRGRAPNPQARGRRQGQTAVQGPQRQGGARAPQAEGLIAPIRIDLDGLMDRAVALPIGSINLAQFDARGQRIYYLTQPIQLISGSLKGEKSALHFYDLKARKDSVIADDVDGYSLSLDGDRVLVKQGSNYTVLDTKADAAKDDDTAKRLELRPHARAGGSAQGVGGDVRERLAAAARPVLLHRHERRGLAGGARQLRQASARTRLARGPELADRSDDQRDLQLTAPMWATATTATPGPRRPAALLGVDWALDAASGRYRIATIYPGDNTRDGYRSPLAQPGLQVKAGDYLLAINGVELRAPTDPDSLLQLADSQTTVDLTVADTPTGARRHVVVKPVGKEINLREAAWIAHNRDLVDKLSGGKIGYVYMTDMGDLGLQQFVRQFYAQLNRQALIMDDRWNGGGFIAPYALERLRRELVALDVNRERAVGTEPNELLIGPKVALLNHWSSSDGDIFPYFFQRYHLGKLVGTRSWGGVRGIRGEWRLMDGGYITIPESALYTPDSQWSVENHGVDPDVEVEDQPAALLAGHDAQLETAVDMLMKQLAGRPAGLPALPPLNPAVPAQRHGAAAAAGVEVRGSVSCVGTWC